MVRSAVNYQKAAVYLLLRISPSELYIRIVHVLRHECLFKTPIRLPKRCGSVCSSCFNDPTAEYRPFVDIISADLRAQKNGCRARAGPSVVLATV
jgi:hypothetical protein